MNRSALSEKSNAERKLPLILVSALGFLFAIVSRLTSFLGYQRPGELIFYFSPPNIILCLMFVVPFVLLLLHAILGQRKFLPIAFGLLTASSLYVFITAILGHSTIPYTVINLLLTCAYILALVNSFKGFTIKALTWVACCLVWLVSFVYLMDLFSAYSYYTEHNFHLYVWTGAGNALALDLLGYWLLLFGLKKTASPKKKKDEEPLDTEEALRLLQEKLELGIIDNVEYQLRRAEIISKI